MDLDLEQDLPAGGTVDLGGLDQVAGDALQAGHIDDHHVADLLPAHQDDQADEAVALVQSQQGLAQVGEHAVEQDLPDVAQQDAADQVGVPRMPRVRASAMANANTLMRTVDTTVNAAVNQKAWVKVESWNTLM